MRVAYVTTYDPRDLGRFSGTGYFIGRSLRQAGLSVRLVGPIDVRRPLALTARYAFHRLLTKKLYLWNRDPAMARRYAAEVRHRLVQEDHDVVVIPDTIPVAHLEHDRPIVTWADSTFLSMLGFYPGFNEETLARESVEAGIALDAHAIERARLLLYPSHWAARSAVEDFGASPQKIEVVPYGANLHSLITADEASAAIASRPRDRCRLLFIGVDWKRKGALKAVAVAEALNRAGLPTELTIVGSEPPVPKSARPFVEMPGFVGKTSGADSRLGKLLRRAHFLILPTEAETYGIVLCEANAYAVPCLTTDVGGVPTVVRDGANGALLAAGAAPEAYVARVVTLFDDFDAYVELARSSHNEYRRRLNWPVAAARVRELLEGLADGAGGR